MAGRTDKKATIRKFARYPFELEWAQYSPEQIREMAGLLARELPTFLSLDASKSAQALHLYITQKGVIDDACANDESLRIGFGYALWCLDVDVLRQEWQTYPHHLEEKVMTQEAILQTTFTAEEVEEGLGLYMEVGDTVSIQGSERMRFVSWLWTVVLRQDNTIAIPAMFEMPDGGRLGWAFLLLLMIRRKYGLPIPPRRRDIVLPPDCFREEPIYILKIRDTSIQNPVGENISEDELYHLSARILAEENLKGTSHTNMMALHQYLSEGGSVLQTPEELTGAIASALIYQYRYREREEAATATSN